MADFMVLFIQQYQRHVALLEKLMKALTSGVITNVIIGKSIIFTESTELECPSVCLSVGAIKKHSLPEGMEISDEKSIHNIWPVMKQ